MNFLALPTRPKKSVPNATPVSRVEDANAEECFVSKVPDFYCILSVQYSFYFHAKIQSSFDPQLSAQLHNMILECAWIGTGRDIARFNLQHLNPNLSQFHSTSLPA
jgi:hypothetical protein